MYRDSHHSQHTSTSNRLSPNLAQSNSVSPSLDDINTPAESVLSTHYPASVYSDLPDDPFCGVDFNVEGGSSPSFLEDGFLSFIGDQTISTPPNLTGHAYRSGLDHPPSPNYTPLQPAASPNVGHKGLRINNTEQFPLASVSPQELSQPFDNRRSGSLDPLPNNYTLTPSTSSSGIASGGASDDGLAPMAVSTMPLQSPHVLVTSWDNHSEDMTSTLPMEGPVVPNDELDIRSDMAAQGSVGPADETTDDHPGRGGIPPEDRPTTEVPSLNETTAKRELDEKNKEVSAWLTQNADQPGPGVEQELPRPPEEEDNISPTEIPLGDQTENKLLPGQTYFLEHGGKLTDEDLTIMKANRTFADAPVLRNIHTEVHQPETAQQAILKFNRMVREFDQNSMLSRAATWGTRRRSLPSSSVVNLGYEEELSGNFLKKMSLGKDEDRRPNLISSTISRVSSLVKRQSVSSKRSRPSISERNSSQDQSQASGGRRESKDSLKPPSRTDSGGMSIAGKRQQVPNINTAFISMGASVASIGSTTHARNGSISTTPTVTSPKSPNTLFVGGVRRRISRARSGSELTDLWKKQGGPPVAMLAKTASDPAALEPATAPVSVPAAVSVGDMDSEDEEDAEEESYEDVDEKQAVAKSIDGIEPTFEGFKEHILRLNPLLRDDNTYLADRLAYHQVARYKQLLGLKVKHLNSIAGHRCSSGSMCIGQGGRATALEGKGDARQNKSATSARYDPGEGDRTPLEDALTQQSFPPNIPMPPTSTLPAEFECQLCFVTKKYKKPSDWTKHVHEDVQPFSCTFGPCKESKIFKRKADWVRHENEGHRHLEWWTCNVDECRHRCYRRDNFLQHLVREHKFPEPKHKTKKAIQRAGRTEPALVKVQECWHKDENPASLEACRFCGNRFLNLKKLTVHLAKHMEQISLPVLRLVARKELETDTIISPIREPPVHSFPAPVPAFSPNNHNNAQMGHSPLQQPMDTHQSSGMDRGVPNFQQPSLFPMAGATHITAPQAPHQHPFQQQAFYSPTAQQYGNNHQMYAAQMVPVTHGLVHPQNYGGMPVTTGYMAPTSNPYISVAPDIEPFPSFVGLGLQDVAGPNEAGQTSYNAMMDPSGAGAEHYTPHGSVSPFSHSPNQGQGSFYR